jgi:glycosyltransferase involved in cell wall biosynthesis
MRVVILYNSSWYVFLLRRNLISSLIQAGHHVTVVAPSDAYTERVKKLGVDFRPITMSRSGTALYAEFATLRQIYEALQECKPHAVLSFTVKCNLYAGLCKRRMTFLHVANISGLGQLFDGGTASQRAAHLLYRFSLARTDHVFFQNRDDMGHLVGHRLVDVARSSLIPGSGVDLSRFTPVVKPAAEKRAFLMFGRILPKKGFYHFIEAATELKKRFGNQVVFWVLGAPDLERAESVDLLARIMDAHARGVIRYLQSTDDPLPFIREADVIVLPSTYNEGVPRSLLEALACGKPIVTTDWTGCRETVDNGRNGYLVTPNSTDSLITALSDLVTSDDGQLAAFGKRSREIAEERFDERVVIDAYHRALAKHPSQRDVISSGECDVVASSLPHARQ